MDAALGTVAVAAVGAVSLWLTTKISAKSALERQRVDTLALAASKAAEAASLAAIARINADAEIAKQKIDAESARDSARITGSFAVADASIEPFLARLAAIDTDCKAQIAALHVEMREERAKCDVRLAAVEVRAAASERRAVWAQNHAKQAYEKLSATETRMAEIERLYRENHPSDPTMKAIRPTLPTGAKP